MSGTGVGLLIGLAYGAVLGIYAYRWYTRQREALEGDLSRLREQQYELARRIAKLSPEETAAA